ncbi:MAG: hypothetical protein AUJ98_04010 [Bacteroidetes bacterium CG2_30_33_31]|nr:MAG: hypothetical protein AUJ98_04010 [Bacteroidetes bacterium CG2_30_33_31]
MKKTLLFIIAILSFVIAEAQLHISTDTRKDAYWNATNEEWVITSTNTEELTFFNFNKAMTLFKHVTPSMTSAYIIDKVTNADDDKKMYEFDITSDVGNKYHMYIDEANMMIYITYTDSDDVLHAVIHIIKKIWNDSDSE